MAQVRAFYGKHCKNGETIEIAFEESDPQFCAFHVLHAFY